MDPASTRILSGSRDYTMHMYDFGGMKADMKAFRTLTPSEGHPVLAASWSTTGVPFLGNEVGAPVMRARGRMVD